MKRFGFLLAVAASVTMACGPRENDGAVGTTGRTEPGAAATREVSNSDKDFVKDISIANTAEVELGKLAVKQSTNADVKKFAQMMIDDHTAAGQKLRSVATAHTIIVPDAMDDTHQSLYTKLAGLKGAEFDREYMNAMVDGHESVLGKLESRIDKASLENWRTRMGNAIQGKESPEPPPVVAERSDDQTTFALNEWAAGAYPTVYRHHHSAEGIYDRVKSAPARTQ